MTACWFLKALGAAAGLASVLRFTVLIPEDSPTSEQLPNNVHPSIGLSSAGSPGVSGRQWPWGLLDRYGTPTCSAGRTVCTPAVTTVRNRAVCRGMVHPGVPVLQLECCTGTVLWEGANDEE